jgi:hypothetical protein
MSRQLLEEIRYLQHQREMLIQRQEQLALLEEQARQRLEEINEREYQNRLVGSDLLEEINRPPRQSWSPTPVRRRSLPRAPVGPVYHRRHGHFQKKVPAMRRLDMSISNAIPWDKPVPRDRSIQSGLTLNNYEFEMHQDKWTKRRPFMALDFGKEPIANPKQSLLE